MELCNDLKSGAGGLNRALSNLDINVEYKYLLEEDAIVVTMPYKGNDNVCRVESCKDGLFSLGYKEMNSNDSYASVSEGFNSEDIIISLGGVLFDCLSNEHKVDVVPYLADKTDDALLTDVAPVQNELTQ